MPPTLDDTSDDKPSVIPVSVRCNNPRTMTRLTWLHCCLFRTNTISCSSFCLSKTLLSCRHTATALVSTKSTECLLEQVEGPVNGMQWNSSQRASRLSYLMYCHATFWGLKFRHVKVCSLCQYSFRGNIKINVIYSASPLLNTTSTGRVHRCNRCYHLSHSYCNITMLYRVSRVISYTFSQPKLELWAQNRNVW